MENIEEIASYESVHERISILHKTIPSPEPWIIAHGYDPETKTWNHGTYFESAHRAKRVFLTYVVGLDPKEKKPKLRSVYGVDD